GCVARAPPRAQGVGAPALGQLLLSAWLRAMATVVANAVRLSGVRFSFLSGECHADVEPDLLPRSDGGLMEKKNEVLATRSNDAMRYARRWTGTAASRTGTPTGISPPDRNSNRNFDPQRELSPEFRHATETPTRNPRSHRTALASG